MSYQEGQNKHFSKRDYDRSDPHSKATSAAFLQQLDPAYQLQISLHDQPNMGPAYDFTIQYGGQPLTVETEQKLGWISSDGTFVVVSPAVPDGRTYKTVDVPGRKWKSTADLFIMLNTGFDALCMTAMKNVKDADMKGKNTSVGTLDELFFKVPIEQFEFYFVTDGTWTKYSDAGTTGKEE
jgi:hypothetical protein